MAASAAVAFSAWIDRIPPSCRRPEEAAAAATAVGIERARQTTGKVNFMVRFLGDRRNDGRMERMEEDVQNRIYLVGKRMGRDQGRLIACARLGRHRYLLST